MPISTLHLVERTLRSVLESPTSTTSQRLEATQALMKILVARKASIKKRDIKLLQMMPKLQNTLELPELDLPSLGLAPVSDVTETPKEDKTCDSIK